MRGIGRLIQRDLAHATRNAMAVIVLIGLVVLPSLFTWFNVIASWDPFANTKSLAIAVANTDEGYQSDLVPLRLNLGEQVLAALRANDDFDWHVTSKEEAIDGTRSGEYYASIIIPPDFSEAMMTFYADGGLRTEIDYYTNEKLNALAPTITGQGASAVSADINQVFAQTLVEVGLNVVQSLANFLEEGDTQVVLTQLESRLEETASQLRSAAATADSFASLFSSSESLATSAAGLITGTAQTFGDAKGALGQAKEASSSLRGNLVQGAQSLTESLAASSQGYQAVGDQIHDVVSGLQSQTDSQTAVLRALSERVQTQIDGYRDIRRSIADIAQALPVGNEAFTGAIAALDHAISRQETVKNLLDEAATGIDSGTAQLEAMRTRIDTAVSDARASIDELRTDHGEALEADLLDVAHSLTSTVSALSTVGEDLSGIGEGLSGASASIVGTLERAAAVIEHLGGKLSDAADTFDSLGQAVAKARQEGDFGAVRELLTADPASRAMSLAAPIDVEREEVFPVANFGSAMSPLYSVLALWVGALLVSVTIRVDVPNETIPGHSELRPVQKYWGRYGIFAIIGLAQSTLMCVGNLVFVQVQAVHPWLYLLAGWVTSLAFTLIVYTAVVAFGNAGKALCVLLLVFQISSAGGAYPLQLLPQWFRELSQFMPATYAIDAFRAAIAGVYQGDYWVALGVLLLFLIPVVLVGLVLRRLLANFNRKTTAALESTKLM